MTNQQPTTNVLVNRLNTTPGAVAPPPIQLKDKSMRSHAFGMDRLFTRLAREFLQKLLPEVRLSNMTVYNKLSRLQLTTKQQQNNTKQQSCLWLLPEVPRDLVSWCCGEFATTAESIRRWPRSTWEALFSLAHCCGKTRAGPKGYDDPIANQGVQEQ